MEEEKITLDRESFRALASDTRVEIIKSLGRRRKMLTELSRQLGMSPSTVKEHMDNLARAGLVVQIDDGHKWKYYELTRKGENILHPSETRVWIILSVSVLGFIASAWSAVLSMATEAPMMLAANVKEFAERAPPVPADEAFDSAGSMLTQATGGGVVSQFPLIEVLGAVLFGAVIALCVYRIARSRKKATSL